MSKLFHACSLVLIKINSILENNVMVVKLSASVGINAVNKKDDVMFVQQKLNALLMSAGGKNNLSSINTNILNLGLIPPFEALKEDGGIGAKTIAAIVWFQKNILESSRPDGIINPNGPTLKRLIDSVTIVDIKEIIGNSIALPVASTGIKLTDTDYNSTANDLGLEVEVIKAVTRVESNGSGFTSDSRPIIRFEAHIFSSTKYGTNHFYDKLFPTISVLKRNNSLVQGGDAGQKREYDRLIQAMALDSDAALKSTSWGLFQIMGFNYQTAGFNSVGSMIKAMYKSEGEQLKAFASFISKNNLVKYLKKDQHDWTGFALHYNGTDSDGEVSGGYDKKIEKQYNTLVKK